MRFSSLAGSSRQYSHNLRECWVPFPLLFSDSSFPSLRYFPYVHAVINILLNSWGGLSADVWSSLSIVLFLFQYSDLQTLAALVSPDSQHLLNPGNLPCSTWVIPFCAAAWKLIKAVSWGNYGAHRFSRVTVLCCLMSSVLKTIVSCVLSDFLLVSNRSVNLIPIIPSCLGVKFSLSLTLHPPFLLYILSCLSSRFGLSNLFILFLLSSWSF